MKDFAKSIVCNTKAEAEKVGNSNKAEIIEKKKKEGATLKVDNGQKIEFSDGSTYVKTSFSDDYREAHNYTGNTRTGNSYNWEERRGHQELYDPTVPFGGHVRGYVEKTKNGYVGAKTNGSILIAKKEFATEAEAKKFVENKQTGNSKVGNATIVDLMGQAKEYNTKFWEAYRKADQKEAEKWSGYAKILKRQIAEERSDIQQRLKKLDEAEKMISFSY